MANHEGSRTTRLYDRRNDEVLLDELERINLQFEKQHPALQPKYRFKEELCSLFRLTSASQLPPAHPH